MLGGTLMNEESDWVEPDEELRKQFEAEVLAELDKEWRPGSYVPLRRFIRVSRYTSISNGRGRSSRRVPREVVVIRRTSSRRWVMVDLERDDSQIPWDDIAGEIYSPEQQALLPEPPGDYLRHQIAEILKKKRRI